MLTDDTLTRELRAAFDDATADLEYGGRVPRLRRSPVAALPAVAAGLALAGVPLLQLAGGAGDTPAAVAPAGPPSTSAPAAPGSTGSTAAPAPTPEVVDDTVRLAGFRLAYTRDAVSQGPLVARRVDQVPDAAEPVAPAEVAGQQGVRAGQQPTTGEPALFLEGPEGPFTLSGAGWTREQLVAVLSASSPTTVPLV
jgi:hypothetical protein